MANISHTDYSEWEVDPSTRQSVHAYTKYKPFAIATSTTAVDLLTVSKGEIATNLVTNPRLGSSTISMFVAEDATLSHSTDQFALGTHSLKVDPNNSGAGEGFYWVGPVVGTSVHAQHITAQVEHRGASAASAVKLEIKDAAGTTVLATSGSSNLATSWTRVTATYTVPPNTAAAAYRLYVTTQTDHNINYYVDKIMYEIRLDDGAVKTYLDGASGINYEWTGTANASTSRKRPSLSVIKGIKITNDTGSVAVYVAFDSVATATETSTSATTTSGIKILGGETFESNWPLDFRKNVSVVSASGTPAVHGVIWGTTTG
tara:strand:+ start:343 stop:1293 length:951 start_codon:yes stop_codon:yes gene_type:complete